MVLINRTNEANIRQLDSLAICRKGMTLREQSRTKLTTDKQLVQLHSSATKVNDTQCDSMLGVSHAVRRSDEH